MIDGSAEPFCCCSSKVVEVATALEARVDDAEGRDLGVLDDGVLRFVADRGGAGEAWAIDRRTGIFFIGFA